MVAITFGGQPITIKLGENTDLAVRSAATASAAAAAAQAGVDRYFATIAAGVAGSSVGQFFASAESGSTRVYLRTGTSPFYVDQGDAAAPITRPLLGAIANIRTRSASTAAAFKTLSQTYNLEGYAGDVHVNETVVFLERDNFKLYGNGATIRNTNTTALTVNDTVSYVFFLGTSNYADTHRLTPYAVSSASGPIMTSVGNGSSKFAVGDKVVMLGATRYDATGAGLYYIYRNYHYSIVIAVTADTITLESAPPRELLADTPTIANATQQSLTSVWPEAPGYHLLYAPMIENVKLKSDVGGLYSGGGVINGVFRDIVAEGRNGWALNAMHNCLVDGLRFTAWRKCLELAEGSHRTVIRNVRGSIQDWAAKGDIGASPFFVAMNENCAACTFDDLDLDFGATSASGNAVQLGSGRDNEIRNARFRGSAHTGVALAVQARSEPGMSNLRSGYRNVYLDMPTPSSFFSCNDGGAGIDRAYCVDSTFIGTPTVRGSLLAGTNGSYLRNYVQNGNIEFAGTVTGWRIEGNTVDNGALTFPTTFTNNRVVGNYFKNGFNNLTSALLRSNTIADNDSDANRSLNAAAVIDDTPATTAITTTTANTPRWSMVCPAGTLSAGDRILIRARLAAGGTGAGGRNVAVGASTPTAGRQGCGSRSVTATGSMNVECELVVVSNTLIFFRTSIGGTEAGPSSVAVDNLTTNALTITVEAWSADGVATVVPYGCRIVPRKPGMREIPGL